MAIYEVCLWELARRSPRLKGKPLFVLCFKDGERCIAVNSPLIGARGSGKVQVLVDRYVHSRFYFQVYKRKIFTFGKCKKCAFSKVEDFVD